MSGVWIAVSWSNSQGEQWEVPTDEGTRGDQFAHVSENANYAAVCAGQVKNTEASRDQETSLWVVLWISPTGIVTRLDGFDNEAFAEQLERAYTHSLRLLPARAPVEVDM